MLHPGIGGDNEVAAQPRPDEDEEGRPPVADAAEFLFAIEKEVEESGLKEEREQALHGKGLPDNTPGGFGKFGPVGAELKFHGNAGDDAKGKIDTENFRPETGGAGEVFVARAEGDGLENDEEQGEAHGQLWEEIVESDGKGEVQTMDVQRGTHRTPLTGSSQRPVAKTTGETPKERTPGTSFADFGRKWNEQAAWIPARAVERRMDGRLGRPAEG